MHRMNRVVRTTAMAASFGLAAQAAPAQLLTTRGLFIAGVSDTSHRTRFVSRAEVFSIFETTMRRSPTYKTADYRLGVVADLMRFPNGPTIGLVLGTEMHVSPDNRIGFDPRGVLWEEQLSLFDANRGLTWSASAFLRCRHDVDNGTPTEALDSVAYIEAHGRVVVLRGVQLGAASREWRPIQKLSIRTALQLEGYVRKEERRTPTSDLAPDWTTARGAVIATIRARVAVNDRMMLYTRTWESHVVFATSEAAAARLNRRIEIGAHLTGPAGGGDLFFVRERTFDDTMTPRPRGASLSSIGLRVAGPTLF
jgi:hypothetical protein